MNQIAKAVEELDEIVRFAHANALAGTKDDQRTWDNHARKCAEVAAMLRQLSGGLDNYPGQHRQYQESACMKALRSIAAMLEPTDEMVKAAFAAGAPPGNYIRGVYRAMIDAALSGGD